MDSLILLVDDKPQIAKIISVYLTGTYRTEYCNSGRSAMDRLTSDPLPDLIVTDVNMPDMDGYELLRGLKESERLRSIPVIVLSSLESSADRIRLLDMGADDFMLKPFNPEELKIRVKHLLK